MLSTSLSRRKNQEKFYYRFKVSIISLLAVLILIPLSGHNAQAADVTLEWDRNPEPDTSYNAYYGLSSRDYSKMVDVGNFITCTIGDLESGVTYYFAITAYNAAGESGYSDEVTYTPAELGPGPEPVDAGGEGGSGCFVGSVTSGANFIGSERIGIRKSLKYSR
jgi:hypothetical protein